MAHFKTDLHAPLGTSPYLLTFTQQAPAKGVALTAEELVSGARNLSAIYIDNSLNAASSYLRLWEANPGGMGTTRAEFIIPVAANSKVQYSFAPAIAINNLWAAVLSAAPYTTTTAPEGTVTTRFLLGS